MCQQGESKTTTAAKEDKEDAATTKQTGWVTVHVPEVEWDTC